MSIGRVTALGQGLTGSLREQHVRFQEAVDSMPEARAVPGLKERIMPLARSMQRATIEKTQQIVTPSSGDFTIPLVKVIIVSGQLISQWDLINVTNSMAKRANAGSSAPLHATHIAYAVAGRFVTLLPVRDATVRYAAGETTPSALNPTIVYLSRTPGKATMKIPQPSDGDYATWGIVQVVGYQVSVPDSGLLGQIAFEPQAPNGP